MNRRLASGLALLLCCAPIVARAQTTPLDSAAGRAQLEEGYALKVKGRYQDAIPHLVESMRLDPQTKTLLNLADCEEHVGLFASAQRHWLLARDQTAPESAMRREVEARLPSLERRMPKLVLTLADSAPRDGEVTRDGVVLGSVSLGIALPADPGKHVIVLRAPAHEDASVEVELVEGETRRISLVPGPLRLVAPAPSPIAVPVVLAPDPAAALSAPPTSSTPADTGASHAHLGALFWGGAIAAGTGIAVGLAVGGLSMSKTSSLSSECPGHQCMTSTSGGSDYDSARSLALGSDVAFAFAGAGAVVAVIGLLTARHHEPPSDHGVSLWVGPRAAGIGGRFQ